MPEYRRWRQQGGCFFFTVNLHNRRSHLLTENIRLLRHCFASVRRERPFNLDAAVILPDHLHCIWTLPPNDADFSTRWRLIKSRFTRKVRQIDSATQHAHENGPQIVWQKRYWEHLIRDEEDFQRHADYIHYNPVKHGHVKYPTLWPYSSLHRWIKIGWLEPAWGQGTRIKDLQVE